MDRNFLQQQGLDEAVIDAVLAEHEKVVADMAFAQTLSRVIADAGGRSEKAVAALLDMDAIRQSDDPKQAAQKAVQQLKVEQDYLFAPAAPRYAPGTGTGNFQPSEPKSLAEALKERFGR